MEQGPAEVRDRMSAQPASGIVVLTLAMAFVHVAMYGILTRFTDGGHSGTTGLPAFVDAVLHPLANLGEVVQRSGSVDFPRGRVGSLIYTLVLLADSLLYGFVLAVWYRRVRRGAWQTN